MILQFPGSLRVSGNPSHGQAVVCGTGDIHVGSCTCVGAVARHTEDDIVTVCGGGTGRRCGTDAVWGIVPIVVAGQVLIGDVALEVVAAAP